MKKCLLLTSALLLAATACQPKVKQEKPKAVEQQCKEEEEEASRSVSDEFSREEEQFHAITESNPQQNVAEDLVQEGALEQDQPVAEAVVEEVKPVADAVEQNQSVVEKAQKATTENEPAVVREPVKAKKENASM
jgi:cytoskeletal protein RodZ